VTAVADNLESPNSAEGSTAPIPAAPVNLGITGGVEQVQLDWADNTEPGLTGYQAYRSTFSGVPYDKLNPVPVVSSEYMDMDTQDGTLYYYVITAVAGGVESANSLEVNASALPKTANHHWLLYD
jgi:fibronectin type 3 domain-containing protein